MNWLHIIPILTAAGFSYLGARLHSSKIWEWNKNRWGTYRATFAYMFGVAILIVFHSWVYVWIYNGGAYEWTTIWYSSGWGVITWFEYWLCFDGFLNLRLGRSWNNVSETNGKLTDRLFKGNYILQLAAKLGMLALGIGILLLI
jgi:hypothetical protein